MNSATNTASDETKPAKRKHVRKRRKRTRPIQIAEGTARIKQVAREQGIFAVMTMNTRQLSMLLFPDGHDHRKAAGRARKALMDEHRKRAADNLKRGELLATVLKAEPKQPETEPIEQQPKLGTQLDTGRK
ncbi:hypothetical protein QYC20_17505 (plasmid) [Lactiplantibacillus pentosus]|uniref:hypothetical protein n=1 Tax=Lactiplantibacillus pentosus TaxID=1589 RepID=UPI00265B4201|nr:hypothetical protein [Lactiplantibacillus pentosus]WKF77767.1 hypothetical protein QYC20_17505 [Lactiplantibacillus pentosus]